MFASICCATAVQSNQCATTVVCRGTHNLVLKSPPTRPVQNAVITDDEKHFSYFALARMLCTTDINTGETLQQVM